MTADHHPASIAGQLAEPIAMPDGWTPSSWRVYDDIRAERYRAHVKHQDKPGGSMEMHRWESADWIDVLGEEVGEVHRARCDHRHELLSDAEYVAALRSELVQVAAMAAAWIDAIDRATS